MRSSTCCATTTPCAGTTNRIERGLHINVRPEPERLQGGFFRGIKRLPVRLVSDHG
ncbi:hypothetical protein [Thermomonospora curvata]|uniref:hypothetical protein n=1 Tax=Thermomonospora curvata TaxID=2020 RepID=UPI00145C68A6|nr:hypothetical protein [Thermomonospora curvata]